LFFVVVILVIRHCNRPDRRPPVHGPSSVLFIAMAVEAGDC
jgi:hypothetical protein